MEVECKVPSQYFVVNSVHLGGHHMLVIIKFKTKVS